MENRNIVTISNVLDCGLNDYINYNNQIVISHIKDLSLFQYPCHLKATTIVICLNGTIEGNINLKGYQIGRNSVLINFPENIIHINRVESLEAYAIMISSEYMHELSLDVLSHSHVYSYEISKNESFVLPDVEIRNVMHYLEVFRQTISRKPSVAKDQIIKHLASAFVTNLIMYHHVYHVNNADSSNGSKSGYMILDKFIELIGVYHTHERELRFYAEKMNITPKHLTNTVKKLTGRKASDWISEFVILEAKSMLKYSGKNVQQVALELNFPTQSAFGKYFKSQVGVSPVNFAESDSIV